jgi:hypothetical protein
MQENQPQITSRELVLAELESLIQKTKESVSDIQRFTIDKLWNILQLAIASIIQIIEIIATDLSSPEKKQLAITSINVFYDKIFLVVDIPMVPSILEKYLHSYVKNLVMILAGATIDSMVKIFRETGVFKPKLTYSKFL